MRCPAAIATVATAFSPLSSSPNPRRVNPPKEEPVYIASMLSNVEPAESRRNEPAVAAVKLNHAEPYGP